MSKLYFYYSAMNAGKSSTLLQTSFNYRERGMETDIYIPQIIGTEYVSSRIGLKQRAISFSKDFNFYKLYQEKFTLYKESIDCILVDEAQFLTKNQVLQLCKIVDMLKIPVLCFGIRTDFQGETFEGSHYLLGLADKLIELRTICSCGKKATMNQRIIDTKPILDGDQIVIGGDKYISLCRKCFLFSNKNPNI